MSDIQVYTAADVVRSQRTEKGLAYEKLVKGASALRRSPKSQHKEMWKRLNDDLLTVRGVGVTPGSVHSNTFLSNMSVQYANDAYIGEQLMPMVGVEHRSDTFATYPKRERLAYPDDAMGSRSQANELDESRSSDNYSVKDYGFKNFVSAETVANEDPIFDEMMDLVDAINEGIAYKREKRLATLLTTSTNYASGNTTTLSGASQWDSSAGGDPIGAIQTALATIWQGRGATMLLGFCNLDVFNTLARHPVILDLLKYQRSGLAKRSEIADIFGLDDLLVGAAREDTANSGQTASYGRIWGKHFGIVRAAKRPGRRSAQFGSIFRLNSDPQTFQWFDPDAGKAGGYYAKVAVSEDAKIVASDTGYLIVNAIS